jgi:hypothetical protein
MTVFNAKVFAAAAVTACFASSAYAQLPAISLTPQTISKTPEEKDADAARDKAYKESLKKIPDAKAPADPWGIARGADAPKTVDSKSADSKSVDKTSAPAKPRTKTGSTAN